MNLFNLTERCTLNAVRSRKRGFTLVELLIVIVILGILAALIVPRLLAQPERGRIAEGVNFLGVLRRAQITRADSVGSNAAFVAVSGTATGWTQLGVTAPAAGTGFFAYVCNDSTGGTTVDQCVATRNNVPAGHPYANATISINLTTGIFAAGCAPAATCTQQYTVDPANNVVTA